MTDHGHHSVYPSLSTGAVLAALALCGLGLVAGGPAQADVAAKPHGLRLQVHSTARPGLRRLVAGRVLTVHRHAIPRYVGGPTYQEAYGAPGLVRRWNDPNLYSFGGWRIGGDNFYGDQAGDTITRGNATLGAISGYGAARGGYGGPHFDAVGGFHDGPGPDAQEDADYASGSISTPDYDRPMPNYPSVKARVAALNTGVVPTVGARFMRASVRDASPASTAPAASSAAEPGYARSEDIFPDIGIDAF